MNIFFCDICGTFDGDELRSDALNDFFSEISNLCDDLEFCFLSNENVKVVKNYVEEILPYLKIYNIFSIKHFADKYDISDGEILKNIKISKVDKVIDYLNFNNVENIYYADDSASNQFFTRIILTKRFPNCKIISFVPGYLASDTDNTFFSNKAGINGLNEILHKYNKHYQRKR